MSDSVEAVAGSAAAVDVAVGARMLGGDRGVRLEEVLRDTFAATCLGDGS